MSRRRKKDEEHENHERWLVSYADFITLLFAFFVVMYAISVVNEGKYRVLSDSISSAFRNIPGSTSGAMTQINPSAPMPVSIPFNRPQVVNLKTDAEREKNRDLLRNKAVAAGGKPILFGTSPELVKLLAMMKIDQMYKLAKDQSELDMLLRG